ncbi:MAG TPA: T9SS type A sorting domain-containing protein [Chitinophagaceae bacterium]|nr:T9SS type A sorting domain-containing protein [Chitinophagaceae bacterium]
MKKFYSLVIIVLISMSAWSQTRSWVGGSGDWNDITKWTPAGIPSEDDVLEFAIASGTISNVPSKTFKGIIISGCDIVLNGAAGGTRTLTLGYPSPDASIHINADATLTIGNNLDLGLALNSIAVIDGTVNIATNRQYITNVGGTTKTIVNGTIRNNGGTILSGENMLEFTDGSIYEHAMNDGAIPLATWSKNSNCNITGVVTSAPAGLNQSFGNYKWDCPQQRGAILSANAIPSVIAGSLVINSMSAVTDPAIYLQFPEKIKIDGNFILNGGTCVSRGTATSIEIAGNFIMSGGSIKAVATASNGAININFNGTSNQIFSKSGGTIEKSSGTNTKATVKFSILENASIDFGESVLDGDAHFTLERGAKLITAHQQGISVTGATGSVQVTGTRTYSNDADYAYNGSMKQVTGSGLPLVVRRLIIDNTSGVQADAGVILSKPLAINRELVLANGFLHSSADNMLSIMDGGEVSTLNNSFVEGPIRKAGSSPFTFPTGWAGSNGGLIPIGVSSLSASSIIQAEYKRAPATNKGNTINAPLHHISYCEYWELFSVSGNPTGIVTMYRNSHSNCNPVSIVQDFTTIRVARSNGSAWTQVGNEDGGMNAGTGYVISDSAGIAINKTDKYFALGNISSSKDPLPVFYDNVVAYEKNGGVNIEWSNLTERDIATYFVERSVNGSDYSIISQHLPKSNRDDKASYTSFDPNPAPGANYYRIKTIEKSTKIIFSRIMKVETDRLKQGFSIYPNPLTGSHVILSLSGIKEGGYYLQIINATGQLVYRKNFNNQGSFTTQSLELPSHIKTGIYNVIVTGDNYRQGKSFIVQ